MTADLFGTGANEEAFEPTPAAARARLAAVRPDAYARSRNHLDGAVTRLSPYITHGLLNLPQVLQAVLARRGLDVQHKFVQELGWREYFHHVWRHAGDGILQSLHPGPLPEDAYSRELPQDVAEARTGVPVIDEAVRTLYATGWLHNHARMWLASYLVHLRKLHWRTGADWMYAQLLDGDLASNHLSWQWVAGTASHKPYLFNADNVARYAPAQWHSPGSVIDTDYATLERMAHSPRPVRAGRDAAVAAMPLPACSGTPPARLMQRPSPAGVQGRAVQLVHPWSLGEAPSAGADGLRVGVLVQEFHDGWPWSGRRWHFVATRLAACCDEVWWGPAAEIRQALRPAQAVRGVANLHLQPWLGDLLTAPAPALLPAVDRRCSSFSQYWRLGTRGISQASELLQRQGLESPPGT